MRNNTVSKQTVAAFHAWPLTCGCTRVKMFVFFPQIASDYRYRFLVIPSSHTKNYGKSSSFLRHFSYEEKSKTRLSSPPAPLDREHTPSLITLQKLNCLSFAAPVAATLFQFSPSFYLPQIFTSSTFVLLTSPTQLFITQQE